MTPEKWELRPNPTPSAFFPRSWVVVEPFEKASSFPWSGSEWDEFGGRRVYPFASRESAARALYGHLYGGVG